MLPIGSPGSKYDQAMRSIWKDFRWLNSPDPNPWSTASGKASSTGFYMTRRAGPQHPKPGYIGSPSDARPSAGRQESVMVDPGVPNTGQRCINGVSSTRVARWHQMRVVAESDSRVVMTQIFGELEDGNAFCQRRRRIEVPERMGTVNLPTLHQPSPAERRLPHRALEKVAVPSLPILSGHQQLDSEFGETHQPRS
ncbi:MAG: hypothetical protein JWN03_1846 [Nocardia sp.]|nr:hypothetical protein [Nocardia sp.]